MSEKIEKKPYCKPVLVAHGSVEKITMKEFGSADGILFSGGGRGSAAS